MPNNHRHNSQQEPRKISDALYEQYGKPLEAEHWGEYVAIAPDGRVMLGRDLLDLAEKAFDAFGPGNYIFKVGEKAVGRI